MIFSLRKFFIAAETIVGVYPKLNQQGAVSHRCCKMLHKFRVKLSVLYKNNPQNGERGGNLTNKFRDEISFQPGKGKKNRIYYSAEKGEFPPE